MNAVLNQKLAAVAAHAETLGHGEKSGYLKAQAEQMGMSLATLYRELKGFRVTRPRKRRSDAGKTALTVEEAEKISALILETMRKNGKRMTTVEEAVDMLRANGMISAERVDKDTGEVFKLSNSTIARALRTYRLHPDQILRPAPSNDLQSLHPNHVWQIDASLCVLYYLPRTAKNGGLQMMRQEVFYKNKPKNLERIVNDRVWRYVVTDHTSGCIFVWYVFGGESSENLCETFIQAMQPKGDRTENPFCGVPKMVMLDPGSANTGHGFKYLCRQLGVEVIINKVGNARSKGQVENANNLVERFFESKLSLRRVDSIEDLQRWAGYWMVYFNSERKHSRTVMPRFSAWQKITADQLVLPPPADYCRELVLSRPQERQVKDNLTISFEGAPFDVSEVPYVMTKEKLLIAKNPWKQGSARVQRFDKNGQEYWIEVPKVEINEWGFRTDAAVIGEEYNTHADTPAQTNAKRLDMLAMEASTLEEAASKRKAKDLPFGGRINPFAHQDKVMAERKVAYMPKPGQQMDYNRMEVAEQVLSKVELAKLLKPRIEAAGGDWMQAVQTLQRLYPDGVAASQIEEVFNRLKTSGSLKMVKGA